MKRLQHRKIHGCNQCGFKAAKEQQIEIHKQTKHEGIRYSCDQCDNKALSNQTQKNHKRVAHDGIMKAKHYRFYLSNIVDFEQFCF